MIVYNYLLLVAASFLALLMDLRTGKIPNLLIMATLAAGIGTKLISGGPGGLPGCLAGILLPLIFLWPLFTLRMMGAGDIKLLMALGSLTGFPGIVRLFVLSILAGSLIALVRLIVLNSFRSRFQRLAGYAKWLLITGTPKPYPGTRDTAARIPFSVPVMIGTMLYIGCVFLEVLQ